MPLTTNFNVDPYYDDFDENKDYHRILYKPGNAVQARELTQSQTILQDQIKKFGDHIFQNGSVVTGGQITIQNTAYINLASTYATNDIPYFGFDKVNIYNSANTKRAYVLASYDADLIADQPVTLVINQLFGEPFLAGETIYTSNNDTNAVTYYANVAATDPIGNNQTFSINNGVFYYEGYFVKNQPQSVAIDKYSRKGNAIIGFEVTEGIVDYTQDTSLLDPAQSSSNFQAPGADRYKISLNLSKRSLTSTDLTQFIELATMKNGLPQKVVQTPIYGPLGDELARRTFDESGDYVIKNFDIAVTDSEANSAYANVTLSSGKAYIKGYEFQTIAPTTITIPKPRTVESLVNQPVTVNYGYYIYANSFYGNFGTNQYNNVEFSLLNTSQATNYLTSAATANTSVYANTIIGTGKVKGTTFYSFGANTFDSGAYTYKVFLTDINSIQCGYANGTGVLALGGGQSTVLLPTGFAANNDVYKGLLLKLTAGTTAANPSDNSERTIIDYTYSPGGSPAGVSITSTDGYFSCSPTSFVMTPGQQIALSGSIAPVALGNLTSNVTSITANGRTVNSWITFSTYGLNPGSSPANARIFVYGTGASAGYVQNVTIFANGSYSNTPNVIGFTYYENTIAVPAGTSNATFIIQGSSNVRVTSATGDFVYPAGFSGLKVGQSITLANTPNSQVGILSTLVGGVYYTPGFAPVGTFTGNITNGYANTSQTYYIIATNGSTTFRLSATPGGSAITTSIGSLYGMSFTVSGATITNYANTSASAQTYYIIATNGSTTFQLAANIGDATSVITTVPSTPIGLTYTVGDARIATLSDALLGSPVSNNHRFVMNTTFGSAESLVVRNTLGQAIAYANVSPASKLMTLNPQLLARYGRFQPVIIQEVSNEPLLLRIGKTNVADNTISNFVYTYQRLYQSVPFTGGVSSALSVGTGETLLDPGSASASSTELQYYDIIVTNAGSSTTMVKGQHVPAQQFSVSTADRTISVDGGADMTANIYATISASNPTSKTKTFTKPNINLVENTGSATKDIFGNAAVYVAVADGQTQIAENFVVKKPNSPQYLFVSDVYSINAVFDFNGTAITTSNYNALTSSANVTDRYTVSTGQRDSYYDWSAIVLKPGLTAPRGPLLVRYNRFRSIGSGFFNVDSYTRLGSQENGGNGIDYGQIPNYTTQTGATLKLSDYLDFRPVRKDAVDSGTANNFVLDIEESGVGTKIPSPGTSIVINYSYYLPRIDRIVLNKSRQFNVLQGTPAINPVVLPEPSDAMTLYILSYPPYLTYPSSTQIQSFNNRRYTMKDIGLLERRIQNLELYTSLSIAELTAIQKNDKSVRDSVGLSRPKNGIFVDSFVDKGSAAITAPDFNAAIDIVGRELRGSYNISSTHLISAPSLNYNTEFDGPLLMMSSTNTTFVMQNRASKTLNINPFNVVNFLGSIKLDPASDVWTSNVRLESQNIDLSGGDAARDAWSSIQSTSWGAWNTQWTTTSEDLGSTSSSVTTADNPNQQKFVGGTSGRHSVIGDITTTTTTTTKETQTLNASRTGILSQIVPQQLTKSMGDRLVDISVVNYMREKNVLVIAEKFKPFTTLYPFFDNTKVSKYVAKVNRFQMTTNNLQYKTTIGNSETVKIYAARTDGTYKSTDLIATGGVILTSNNNAFLVNIVPETTYGTWSSATNGIVVVGNVTNKSYTCKKWYHTTGRATGGSSSSITLGFHAGGSQNATAADLIGQTIYIVYGTGKGQSAIISGYDPATRVVTITGTWSTPADSNSVYSIGNLETTAEGSCAGVFIIPGEVFRTGEKLFRLIDDQNGNIENSRTNGDASFYAQGMVQTKQETTVTVFVPNVVRSTVNESFTASTSSIKSATSVDVQQNVVVGYYDPLAQTFLINPKQYPQGTVIDSVRVCFKTKDASVPVSLQLRPVVNGYPSSSTIYPYAEKTLTPDKVNLCEIPDMEDSTKYTEFKFDVPVLLLPGEHSFVLVSNSNGYEAFVAEIGAVDLKTSVKISEQPYTGSLFLSQNGSTWTADQTNDLMFSIQKRVFSTGIGYAYFNADVSQYPANVPYDVLQLMTTDAVVANTALQYDFSAEMDVGGQHDLIPIYANDDYACNDGYGRRNLNPTTGNTSFILRATLNTTNRDISPMIDVSRLNLLTIENKINNMPLQNSGFIIVNGGSGYTGNAAITITPGVGGGSGAAAIGYVVGGVVTRVDLTTNGGLGYLTSPTITANAPTSGTTAIITYNGEDKAVGGNSNIRYLTKKIQLASGFECGDLRVYMDAYRPSSAGILVYYKVLSPSDSSVFENNNWQLMTEMADTLNFASANENDYSELTFAPGAFKTGIPNNKISYLGPNGEGPYNVFNLFAVKIVMFGSNTYDVPKVQNLRVIALPASSGTPITSFTL
jgi:hypothetical protein